jgi:hypothetical protein
MQANLDADILRDVLPNLQPIVRTDWIMVAFTMSADVFVWCGDDRGFFHGLSALGGSKI